MKTVSILLPRHVATMLSSSNLAMSHCASFVRASGLTDGNGYDQEHGSNHNDGDNDDEGRHSYE